MFNSPLSFPVRMQGKKILVLDETLLPWEEKYLEVLNLEDALFCLREMKTRAFGQVLLYFYTCQLLEEEYQDKSTLADLVAKKFKATRPTFDFFSLSSLLKKSLREDKPLSEIIATFLDGFDKARRRRCAALAEVLPQQSSILTICNINGELIYLAEALRNLGKEYRFYVSETRPYLQGARLTTWELQRAGVNTILICDNQVAKVMAEKKVNAVVCGADRANLQGDIINKVGTYALSCLAGIYNIPVYAFVQYPYDFSIEKVGIEERPPQEVFMFLENIPDKENIEAIYPSFDIVPQELISGWVGLEELRLNDKRKWK